MLNETGRKISREDAKNAKKIKKSLRLCGFAWDIWV